MQQTSASVLISQLFAGGMRLINTERVRNIRRETRNEKLHNSSRRFARLTLNHRLRWSNTYPDEIGGNYCARGNRRVLSR